MKKNNFQTPYLKNIALLISKLTMFDSSREKEKHFQKIVAAVEKMNRTELKGEPSYFHTLDMMVWAKSKLNKTNYAVQLVKSSAHSI
jgi:hypothetical protein